MATTDLRAISWSSEDRDNSVFNDPSDYEIEIPTCENVVEIKLGSFELGNLPRHTIEENVDDEIRISEGFCCGSSPDTSAMRMDPLRGTGTIYENEIRIYERGAYISSYVPAHDNVCTISVSNREQTSDTPEGRATITVTCDGPHGLYGLSDMDVHICCSCAYEDIAVVRAGSLGVGVTLIDDFSFSVDNVAVSVAANGTAYGVLHCAPYLPSGLCSALNSAFQHNSIPWIAQFDDDVFRIYRTSGISELCSINYSTSERGIGVMLGYPSRSPKSISINTTKNICKNFFGTVGQKVNTYKVKIPCGFYDISSLASMVTEKLNVLNPGNTSSLGEIAMRFGFTNSSGMTTTIAVPGGHYSPTTLGVKLQTLMSAADTVAYTCAFDWETQHWTISGQTSTTVEDASGTSHVYYSAASFSLHFASTAQAGWHTDTTTTPQITIAARTFGFDMTSYSSKNGLIRSVNTVNYDRKRTLLTAGTRVGSDGVSFIHESYPYETPKHTYIVGGKNPSQRIMTFTARNPHMMNLELTTTSTSNGVCGVLATPYGYTVTPPIPYVVGDILRIFSSTETCTMGGGTASAVSAQVTSVSVGSMILRIDEATLEAFTGKPNSSSPVIVRVTNFDEPSFCIHSSNTDAKIGIEKTIESHQSQCIAAKPWNVDHPRYLLLRLTLIGPTCQQFHMTRVRDSDVQVFAKILISGTGYAHQHGTIMEQKCPPSKISRLRVEILNPDGTHYQTHQQEHSFTLMMISRAGSEKNHS